MCWFVIYLNCFKEKNLSFTLTLCSRGIMPSKRNKRPDPLQEFLLFVEGAKGPFTQDGEMKLSYDKYLENVLELR